MSQPTSVTLLASTCTSARDFAKKTCRSEMPGNVDKLRFLNFLSESMWLFFCWANWAARVQYASCFVALWRAETRYTGDGPNVRPTLIICRHCRQGWSPPQYGCQMLGVPELGVPWTVQGDQPPDVMMPHLAWIQTGSYMHVRTITMHAHMPALR